MPAETPWYQTFFNGLVADSWRYVGKLLPTAAEVEFLQQTFGPPQGQRVLDVPCGDGRLTLEMAQRGYRCRGFDLTEAFLDAGRRAAAERGLDVVFEQGDMTRLTYRDEFDAAFCFGNSFSYFDDAGNAAFLAGVSRALVPGGRFVLETGFAAEGTFANVQRGRWFQFDDLYFLHDTRYDPPSGQLTSTYTLIRDGQVERKQAVYRIYTYRELMGMLRAAGLEPVETFGSLKREPFALGSPSLYVVARRVP